MMTILIRLWRDERAATSIEYALIACGIALAIITAVGTVGTSLNSRYTAVNTALK